MTAFAACISQNQIAQANRVLFHNLTEKLKSQIEGLSEDSFSSDEILATKLWMSHARTHGIVRDEKTKSWLVCIGNPTIERYADIKGTDYSQHLLRDYLEKGSDVITSLSAPFVLVIFDGRKRKINIFTDKVGLQHLYMAKISDSYILSTSSLALASVMKIHIDRNAVVSYFTSGYLLGQRTFYEEIKKINGGMWISFVDGCIKEERYWFTPTEERKVVPINRVAGELAEKLKKAVSLRLDQDCRTSIETTGGMDSRLNLACALGAGREFMALTIGNAGSRELRIAEQLKEVEDFRHYVLSPAQDMKELFLDDLKLIHVLTDGETDCLNLIASPSCNRQMAHLREASISGTGGEILRGFFYISHKGISNKQREVKVDRLITMKMLPNIGVKPKIFSSFFPKNYYEILRRLVNTFFSETSGNTLFWRLDDFYLRAREQRFAGRSCTFNNYFYRQELPYFDNQIIDMAFRMPWKYKKNSRIGKHALVICHPGYAAVLMSNGLPGRPVNIKDIPLLFCYYTGFAKKILSKLQMTFFGRSVRGMDDVGLEKIINNELASKQTLALLEPDNMASAFLYDSDRLREFVKYNCNNQFRDRVQMGLILSFELTCRYIGGSLSF